jgi:hypothetical protein
MSLVTTSLTTPFSSQPSQSSQSGGWGDGDSSDNAIAIVMPILGVLLSFFIAFLVYRYLRARLAQKLQAPHNGNGQGAVITTGVIATAQATPHTGP